MMIVIINDFIIHILHDIIIRSRNLIIYAYLTVRGGASTIFLASSTFRTCRTAAALDLAMSFASRGDPAFTSFPDAAWVDSDDFNKAAASFTNTRLWSGGLSSGESDFITLLNTSRSRVNLRMTHHDE